MSKTLFPGLFEGEARAESVREGRAVRMLQLATEGHTLSQSRHFDPITSRHLLEVVGCRLALDRRIGGDDHLFYTLAIQPLLEKVKTKVLGTEPVQRRQATKQYEVTAGETGRRLDGEHIGRTFNDAQHRSVPAIVQADPADLPGREVAALPATLDIVHRPPERVRQTPSPVPVALEKMQRHPLGAARADAGKTAQRLEQFIERISRHRVAHTRDSRQVEPRR